MESVGLHELADALKQLQQCAAARSTNSKWCSNNGATAAAHGKFSGDAQELDAARKVSALSAVIVTDSSAFNASDDVVADHDVLCTLCELLPSKNILISSLAANILSKACAAGSSATLAAITRNLLPIVDDLSKQWTLGAGAHYLRCALHISLLGILCVKDSTAQRALRQSAAVSALANLAVSFNAEKQVFTAIRLAAIHTLAAIAAAAHSSECGGNALHVLCDHVYTSMLQRTLVAATKSGDAAAVAALTVIMHSIDPHHAATTAYNGSTGIQHAAAAAAVEELLVLQSRCWHGVWTLACLVADRSALQAAWQRGACIDVPLVLRTLVSAHSTACEALDAAVVRRARTGLVGLCNDLLRERACSDPQHDATVVRDGCLDKLAALYMQRCEQDAELRECLLLACTASVTLCNACAANAALLHFLQGKLREVALAKKVLPADIPMFQQYSSLLLCLLRGLACKSAVQLAPLHSMQSTLSPATPQTATTPAAHVSQFAIRHSMAPYYSTTEDDMLDTEAVCATTHCIKSKPKHDAASPVLDATLPYHDDSATVGCTDTLDEAPQNGVDRSLHPACCTHASVSPHETENGWTVSGHSDLREQSVAAGAPQATAIASTTVAVVAERAWSAQHDCVVEALDSDSEQLTTCTSLPLTLSQHTMCCAPHDASPYSILQESSFVENRSNDANGISSDSTANKLAPTASIAQHSSEVAQHTRAHYVRDSVAERDELAAVELDVLSPLPPQRSGSCGNAAAALNSMPHTPVPCCALGSTAHVHSTLPCSTRWLHASPATQPSPEMQQLDCAAAPCALQRAPLPSSSAVCAAAAAAEWTLTPPPCIAVRVRNRSSEVSNKDDDGDGGNDDIPPLLDPRSPNSRSSTHTDAAAWSTVPLSGCSSPCGTHCSHNGFRKSTPHLSKAVVAQYRSVMVDSVHHMWLTLQRIAAMRGHTNVATAPPCMPPHAADSKMPSSVMQQASSCESDAIGIGAAAAHTHDEDENATYARRLRAMLCSAAETGLSDTSSAGMFSDEFVELSADMCWLARQLSMQPSAWGRTFSSVWGTKNSVCSQICQRAVLWLCCTLDLIAALAPFHSGQFEKVPLRLVLERQHSTQHGVLSIVAGGYGLAGETPLGHGLHAVRAAHARHALDYLLLIEAAAGNGARWCAELVCCGAMAALQRTLKCDINHDCNHKSAEIVQLLCRAE